MAINKDFLTFIEMSRIIADVGFYSSAFFCFLLISLTLLTMKKRLGAYANLIVIFSTTGIIFASFEFVLYPNVHSYNAGYLFYITSRPLNLDPDIINLFLTVYSGVYASTISMLAIQFVYRYWGVFKDVMKENYDLDIDDVAKVAVVVYYADGSPRYMNLMGLLNMSSIMALQYAIIIYCAIMMHWNMEQKLRLMSTRKTNLHRQLFKTLVLQITSPSITLFAPVIFVLYLPFFNPIVNFPTGVVLCSATLYPAMDAIIIMCVVTDYRRSARKALKHILELFCTRLKSTEHAAQTSG